MAALHSPEHLHFLRTAHGRRICTPGAWDEEIPDVHPVRRAGSCPQSTDGRSGHLRADTACPITARTWDSACWSARSAVAGAQRLLAPGRRPAIPDVDLHPGNGAQGIFHGRAVG